ncbi:MAG: hypothetical protein LBM77_07610 [Spirochaetaceae bacterium]|jgi:cell fate regulator YaaT (PSP1 superfamily)|nr:hypothetical protein [Spirochaetaceae bacterium]
MSDFTIEDIESIEENIIIEEAEESDADFASMSGASSFIEMSLDVPVYRLKMDYSNDTFLAVFTDDVLQANDMVISPTKYGIDMVRVVGQISRNGPQLVDVAHVIKKADEKDLERAKNNKKLEEEAYNVCLEKIHNRGLDMKLICVHYLLEEPKILFFFFSENRVDFRELVKDLVAVFHSRIELRQIGVRDEARMLGGLGQCGRDFCCHGISDKLKAVTIKMAKEQNLSLNALKISGPCDRLLCCLAYEHGNYENLSKDKMS